MSKHIPLYPWSRKEARRLGEMDKWTESYQANCACARSIEFSIKDEYSNNRLSGECAKGVIEQYGFDRVNWVLANTIQDSMHDGRYCTDNRQWARAFFIPHEEHNLQHNFTVNAHPGLVDIFTNQARREWNALGLYEKSHCYDESTERLDYTGKVVVLRPSALYDEYKKPEYQLFYAKSGNGCRPNAIGTKVFGEFLKDGAKEWYVRGDIIGAIKLDLLPEWAQERYAEITGDDGESESLSIGEPK